MCIIVSAHTFVWNLFLSYVISLVRDTVNLQNNLLTSISSFAMYFRIETVVALYDHILCIWKNWESLINN